MMPVIRPLPRFVIRVVTLAASMVLGLSAHAAVFNVTTSAVDAKDANTADGLCDDGNGQCTLRAAIEQADKLGGVNTINVPAGTYLLSAALGVLKTSNGSNALTISGTGAAATSIVDGQNSIAVLQLSGNGSTINLDNLVIRNGKVTLTNPGGFGACVGAGINVVSDVTVNVSRSVIQNNQAINGSGGGICINFGTFTLDRSTVVGNIATFGGGGIRITSGAPPGTLNIIDSTISANVVPGPAGNPTSAQGAGIISQATVNIRNSTLSGNDTGIGYGSAILTTSNAVTTMRSVTIAANVGSGAQVLGGPTETFTVESTIIAAPAGGGYNCESSAAFTSTGHNLDSGNSCHFNAATDLANVNPNLGPLQNNGGPTATHALLSGSIAIDHGSNPSALALDQLGGGFARVVGAAADIGAYEFQAAGGAATLDVDASVVATRYDALTDGLLVLRYLFGQTGPSLTRSAIGATATRADPSAIKTYLDSIRNALDIDGNGTSDAATDGLLILRYLFGLRGSSLVSNALGASPLRSTPAAIEAQILLLMP